MSLSLLRMRRARSILVADQPFYGIVALRLEFIEDPTCQTLWCNGVQLGFNPRFVRECTELELKAVLTKMTLHAALGHTWRCERRNLKLWNEACDYAVAPIILEAACRLPGVFRARDEFDGWCAEAIYRKLLEEQAQEPPPPPEDGGSDDEGAESGSNDGETEGEAGDDEGSAQPWRNAPVGEIRPAPADCDQDAKQTEFQIAAQQGALAQGDLPGSLNLALAQTGKARVNWKEVLWQFVQASFKSCDYTWSRPNPRYLNMGLYLPRIYGKQTPPLVASIDVSGSIVACPQLAASFMNEVDGVNAQCEPERMDVLYVDTAVRLHETYEPGDTVGSKNLPGGGGTSFVPAFDWVAQQGEDPCCLIYLTDLLGAFPQEEPGYPVLWVVPDLTGKYLAEPPKVPFGEVVVLPAFD